MNSNKNSKLPGFTAETALNEYKNSFCGENRQLDQEAIIPQVVCEQPLRYGSLCCEMWGADLVCYTVGEKHTQM